MKAEYRLWSDPQKPFAGKIVLRPETPEEELALRAFREHVGSPQRGRKFEIIFKWRVVGPRQLGDMLRSLPEGAKSSAT